MAYEVYFFVTLFMIEVCEPSYSLNTNKSSTVFIDPTSRSI